MNFAGILASGTGTRMGAEMPKQFLKIGSMPIIIRVVNTFLKSDCVDKLIIAIHPDWRDYLNNLLGEYGVSTRDITVIPGGETRFLSMTELVKTAVTIGGADDYILVHDCARLFVSQRIIRDNFELAKQYDMVTTAVRTIDTVIIAEDGKQSSSVPERSTVFLDQGPQTFRVGEYMRLYGALDESEIASYMEAGKMYLEHGLKVGIVQGERTNFKITTGFDLALADTVLKEGLADE